MYKNKLSWIFCFLLLLPFGASAQELNTQVRVSTPQLQVSDPKLFEDLESAISDFMNNQTWTNIDYEPEERINVTLQLNIKQELGNNTFTGEIAILATRPVYGSSYETTLLNYLDRDIKIPYAPGQTIQHTQNSFADNLSSILSFYAYYIIGADYDTFKPLGGELYYERALEVINNIPAGVASDAGGWTAGDSDRNRFWLVDNVLNPKGKVLREALYTYHLEGLDIMFSDVTTGQRKVLDALQRINSVHQGFPNSMIVPLFIQAKSQEVLDIMALANRNMKRQVYTLMVKMDAAGANKYKPLR
jgi:hypothetical protein